LRDLKVIRGLKDSKEYKVQRVIKVDKDLKEIQEHKVLKVF
jgi:hypothetical protein